MRLLNVYTLHFEVFADDAQAPPYIIASHRWTDEEIAFQGFENREQQPHLRELAGLKKIYAFCNYVRTCRTDRGLQLSWLWIDTVCINKSDFSELHEAINSMFRWYERAYACIAYLHDVPNVMTSLQVSERHDLEHRTTRADPIAQETTAEALSITEKRAWMAKRKCTRLEDEAYCLLGICGVYMSLIYGERERAFDRLEDEIVTQRRYQRKGNVGQQAIKQPRSSDNVDEAVETVGLGSDDHHHDEYMHTVQPQRSSGRKLEVAETTFRNNELTASHQVHQHWPNSVEPSRADHKGTRSRTDAAADDVKRQSRYISPARGQGLFGTFFDSPARDKPSVPQQRDKGSSRLSSPTQNNASTGDRSDEYYHYFDQNGRQVRPSRRPNRSSSPEYASRPRSRQSRMAKAGGSDANQSRKQQRNLNLMTAIAATASVLQARERGKRLSAAGADTKSRESRRSPTTGR